MTGRCSRNGRTLIAFAFACHWIFGPLTVACLLNLPRVFSANIVIALIIIERAATKTTNCFGLELFAGLNKNPRIDDDLAKNRFYLFVCVWIWGAEATTFKTRNDTRFAMRKREAEQIQIRHVQVASAIAIAIANNKTAAQNDHHFFHSLLLCAFNGLWFANDV